MTFDGLIGLYGQRDMPDELRERIAADVKAAVSDPAIAPRLTATGQEVAPGSAAEFAAAIERAASRRRDDRQGARRQGRAMKVNAAHRLARESRPPSGCGRRASPFPPKCL